MGLFSWTSRLRGQHRVQQLAEIVVEQCRESVWRRVVGRAGTLGGQAEAQGYVQTRALAPVRRKTQHLLSLHCGLPKSTEQRIVEQALGALAGQMVPVLLVNSIRRAA